MTPREIADQLARASGYDPRRIRGPSRLRHVVEQRRHVAGQMRDAGLSYPEIGQGIDRHHTSVMVLLEASPSTSKAAKRLSAERQKQRYATPLVRAAASAVRAAFDS